MILLWTEKNSLFVWASTGKHSKLDLAKALIERNAEHKEFEIEQYAYATNEKAEKVTYKEILKALGKHEENNGNG